MNTVMSLGHIPYQECWDLQLRLVEDRIADRIGDTVVVCSHPPVYTVGRRRDSRKNLLDTGDAPIYEIERGGDVTWHGPGQIVAYPILKLPDSDVLKHLRRLEQAMIDACAPLGLAATRDPRNAGVWHQGRKIGSVGVAMRQSVTWHGLALNVNPDLSWFRRINPCGMEPTLLSSLSAELGRPLTPEDVQPAIIQAMLRLGTPLTEENQDSTKT